MKIQVRKGIKIRPLSKYADDRERSEYKAKLRNIGNRKANKKALISQFNCTNKGNGLSKEHYEVKKCIALYEK